MEIGQKQTASVIEIELDDRGLGSIKIDGQEIANATCGVEIETHPGNMSEVRLSLWAHQLKVTLPAGVIAELREAYTVDDELENRIVERVLSALAKGGRR